MLLKLSKFFLYASLFSVLVVLSGTFFPFIGGKYYFFRVCIELALMTVVFWWAFEARKGEFYHRFKRIGTHPLFIAVSAFVAFFVLASLVAYSPHAAFWSNFERGEGGFQMIHYYLFFMLLLFVCDREEDWRLLLKLSLVAALFMILYGAGAAAFIEGFIGPYTEGTAPTFLGRVFSPTTRFQGSLGNPAYVAPYLMFSLFYVLWLLWNGRTEKKKTGYTVLYVTAFIFFLIFFILSQTRGAFIGLGGAVLAFLLYLLFSAPRLRAWVAFGLLTLILFGSIALRNRDSQFIKNLPASRLFDLSFSDQTVQTRLWTWGSAWRGFKERPLLGWGPENFSTIFDKYFDPRHYEPGKNSETWFDRAHSVFFDYLSETGILGLLSYIGIFATFYVLFFKSRARDAHTALKKAPLFAQAVFFALPIGYLLQGLVLFDVLPIYINLFLFLAFALFEFRTITAHHDPSPFRNKK